jgi:hypothetical protein
VTYSCRLRQHGGALRKPFEKCVEVGPGELPFERPGENLVASLEGEDAGGELLEWTGGTAAVPRNRATPSWPSSGWAWSTAGQLLEARGNLQRMLCEIPLTDDERAAVEEGAMAVENLLNRLADVPTPAGPTPRQFTAAGRQLPVLGPLSIRSSDEGA